MQPALQGKCASETNCCGMVSNLQISTQVPFQVALQIGPFLGVPRYMYRGSTCLGREGVHPRLAHFYFENPASLKKKPLVENHDRKGGVYSWIPSSCILKGVECFSRCWTRFGYSKKKPTGHRCTKRLHVHCARSMDGLFLGVPYN